MGPSTTRVEDKLFDRDVADLEVPHSPVVLACQGMVLCTLELSHDSFLWRGPRTYAFSIGTPSSTFSL